MLPLRAMVGEENRVFGNKSKSMEIIVESIVWSVSKWASKGSAFEGVALVSIGIEGELVCKHCA